MNVSDAPWNFKPSDYSPQQWTRACLIDTEQGATDSKDRYKLPVREPSGALNRHGISAAAGRLNQVDGISAEARAAAARKLVNLYREIGDDPPDSLRNLAGDDSKRSEPDQERLWTYNFKGLDKNFIGVEMRSATAGNGKGRTIGGYAAVFEVPSVDMGFTEMVTRSFFNKSLADGAPGVICRFNHQDNYLLGSTKGRTLRLEKDNHGLNYEVDLPECRQDVLEYVQRGDLGHSSFAFQTFEDEWRTGEGGHPIRMLVSGKLIDVAPVTSPAYPDATVGLRSLARFVGAPIEDVLAKHEIDELRSFFIRTDKDGGKSSKPVKGTFGPSALMKLQQRKQAMEDSAE